MTTDYSGDCWPMLYGKRKRLEELYEAEEQGRSLWTPILDKHARAKLYHAVDSISRGIKSFDPIILARQITLEQEGLLKLSNDFFEMFSSDLRTDALKGILEQDESVVFTLIEAMVMLPAYVEQDHYRLLFDYNITPDNDYEMEMSIFKDELKIFSRRIRSVLQEHWVSFDFIEGRFIPIESNQLHEEVVIPALTLLGHREDFENVETAYRKALDELHTGTPDDAITDAATALQEALLALGCKGNSLRPLTNSALVKGTITGYDRKLIDWVSAERNNKGDAHNVDAASTEDAWLVVHIVGALILRIVGGPLRGAGQ